MARRRRGLDLNLPFIDEVEEEEEDANDFKDLMEILESERTRNIDLDINADPDSDRSLLQIEREGIDEEEVRFMYLFNDPMPYQEELNLFPRNPGVWGRNQERGLDSLQLGLGLQSWFDSTTEGSVMVENGDSSSSSMMNLVDLEVAQHSPAEEGLWFDQGMGDIQVTEIGDADQGVLDWNIECAEALAMIIDNDEERGVSLLHEEGEIFDTVFNGESMSLEFDSDFSHFISLIAELHPDFELEQLPDIESVVNHSVPTAEHVIENLPSVTLTQDDVKKNNAVCSICTDEFTAEEKLKRLPCFHIYHGDCILPWLNIQNTCPICRYKLPTR